MVQQSGPFDASRRGFGDSEQIDRRVELAAASHHVGETRLDGRNNVPITSEFRLRNGRPQGRLGTDEIAEIALGHANHSQQRRTSADFAIRQVIKPSLSFGLRSRGIATDQLEQLAGDDCDVRRHRGERYPSFDIAGYWRSAGHRSATIV
jgi:hypothetical protein